MQTLHREINGDNATLVCFWLRPSALHFGPRNIATHGQQICVGRHHCLAQRRGLHARNSPEGVLQVRSEQAVAPLRGVSEPQLALTAILDCFPPRAQVRFPLLQRGSLLTLPVSVS